MRRRALAIMLKSIVLIAALATSITLAQPTITVTPSITHPGDSVTITIEGVGEERCAIEIRGPGGGLAYIREVKLSNGTGSVSWDIPEAAVLGNYTIYVSCETSGNNTAVLTLRAITPPGAAPPTQEARRVKGIERLIEVGEKLQSLVHCRSDVLLKHNVTVHAELNASFAEVLNLTAEGDEYLKAALEAWEAGNYTDAKIYVVMAIRSYGSALELQEAIGEALNASFKACRMVVAEQPPTPPAPKANVTCKWSPQFYPLMTAFDVAEHRLEELREMVSKLEERGYNVSQLVSLLKEAEELIEEGRALAVNCNISAAALKLAEARRLIGLITAQVHKLGYAALIHKLEEMGIKANMSELRRALKERRFLQKLEEKIEKLLEKIREKQAKLEKHLEKMLERLRERIQESIKRRQGTPGPGIWPGPPRGHGHRRGGRGH
ncbi:MAG: hypothetical protein DRK00_02400 [Thermoprotei archaeon]|nr:MAG: hypothetical protein DRK00_02400 [Thermoprotei archaeon]